MEDRKKALELFAKQIEEGLPFAEDFIPKDRDIENNALRARDLSEEALAHQVMKNTGIPIPNNNAPRLKKEDFLNRLVQERYPELTPNVQLGNEDSYLRGNILVRDNKDLTETVGKSLHEAGHQYDNQILGTRGENLDLKTLRYMKKSGLDLKNMDPAQVYEMYAKGHHQNIPNLREGTYGLGALKSYLKSGTFKALPIIGPALGAAAALSSGDASAAVPLLSEADDVGMSSDDEKQMLAEHNARVNYDKSPAHLARIEALKKLGK